MYRYLSLLLLLISFQTAIAQLDSFNIADYARPDLERRTAGVYGRLNLGSPYYSAFPNTDRMTRNEYDIRAYQTKFVNSVRNQIDVSNTLYSEFSQTNENGMTNSSMWNRISRSYRNKIFSANKKFIEFKYDVSASHRRTREDQLFIFDDFEYISAVKNNSLSIRGGVALYKGKGRIEIISDAWNAQTILEMLQEKGLVDAYIALEDIQAFAERISEIKNIRNTDFRLENIAEQESLVSFLKSKDWANTDDFRFYPTLLDTWRYETFFVRRSGTEFKYGLSFRGDFWDNDFPSNSFTSLTPSLDIAYNKYKPISTDWQFNTSNSLELNVIVRYFDFGRVDTDDLYFRFRSDFEWQYLPNRRSYYTFGFSSSAYIPFRESSSSKILSFTPKAEYVYYFSPRFNITVSGQILLTTYLDDFSSLRVFEALSASVSYRFY